jgi:CRP-like cAMP-binding protein
MLFSPGSHQDRVYLVETGRLQLVAITERGEQWTLGVFGPGAFVDVSRWNLDDDHCFYLVAVLPTSALTIDRDALHALGRTRPEVLEMALDSTEDQAMMFVEKVLAARSEPVRTRLARMLLDLVPPEDRELDDFVPLSQRVTHEEMARSVGASRPHTSTVLGRMQADGVIRGNGGRGLRVRPTGLRRVIHASP